MRVMHAGRRGARWGALLGLACGVLYAGGGCVYDLLTVGLNGGTALAFLALGGMPALAGAAGILAGLLVAGAVNGFGAVARRFRSAA